LNFTHVISDGMVYSLSFYVYVLYFVYANAKFSCELIFAIVLVNLIAKIFVGIQFCHFIAKLRTS